LKIIAKHNWVKPTLKEEALMWVGVEMASLEPLQALQVLDQNEDPYFRQQGLKHILADPELLVLHESLGSRTSFRVNLLAFSNNVLDLIQKDDDKEVWDLRPKQYRFFLRLLIRSCDILKDDEGGKQFLVRFLTHLVRGPSDYLLKNIDLVIHLLCRLGIFHVDELERQLGLIKDVVKIY
jgi:hypothetical protein